MDRGSRWNIAGAAAFAALVLGAAVYVAARSPVVLDGWIHHLWWQDPGSRWWEWPFLYYPHIYQHQNPRLGQVLTRAAYAPTILSWTVLPAIVLAYHVVIPALVLGRWPDPRRGVDLALLCVVAALFWIGIPRPGVVVSYAPITTNYLFGGLVTLALFIPLRRETGQPISASRGRWLTVTAVPAGLAAGLCNEHTGPVAIAAYLVWMAWLATSRRWRPPAWMPLTWLALVGGYAALFFAPGQSSRYQGQALRRSILDRVLQRDLDRTLELLVEPLASLWPLGVVFVFAVLIVVFRDRGVSDALRRRLGIAVVLGLCAAAIVGLTLASPRHGFRLHIGPALLVIIATASVLHLALTGAWLRRGMAGLAVGVTLLGWGMTANTMHIVGAEFDAREARLDRGRPGAVVVLPRYSIDQTAFFHGEDMDTASVRARLASARGLKRIVLGGVESPPGRSPAAPR